MSVTDVYNRQGVEMDPKKTHAETICLIGEIVRIAKRNNVSLPTDATSLSNMVTILRSRNLITGSTAAYFEGDRSTVHSLFTHYCLMQYTGVSNCEIDERNLQLFT